MSVSGFHPAPGPGATPRPIDVTVAILTKNAGTLLARLLHAVAAQETSLAYDLLAIDSGSADETLLLLRAAGARVIEIEPASFNFGTTRDLAFSEAHGGIVVSLSQDAVPAHPAWLENLVRPLREPGVAAACGRSVFDPERSLRQFPWERNGCFYFTREMAAFRRRWGPGLSNANSAIKRDVWERLRFGEQSIGEDFRFQTKIQAAGCTIAFPAGAEALHHHDYTLKSLAKRCRNEGLGLREIGCPYSELDLLRDIASLRKYRVWVRELLAGRLRTAADLAFPIARPFCVYAGSRFATRYAP